MSDFGQSRPCEWVAQTGPPGDLAPSLSILPWLRYARRHAHLQTALRGHTRWRGITIRSMVEDTRATKVRIKQIDIKNYRLFKDVTLSGLSRLVVVIGANGTGKSTLFDVFSFLQEALNHGVEFAVSWRGGFRNLVSRGQNGPIEIEIKFGERTGRQATYMLSVGLDESEGTIVDREVLRCRRGEYDRPWHFVDFRRGSGKAITNEAEWDRTGVQQEWEEYTLTSPNVLAIAALGQLEKCRVVAQLRRVIDNWRISDSPMLEARSGVEAWFAKHDSKPHALLVMERPESQPYPDRFARAVGRVSLVRKERRAGLHINVLAGFSRWRGA